MAKKNIKYSCSNCGYESSGYFGKCPSCGSWGTLNEKQVVTESSDNKINNKDSVSKKLDELSVTNDEKIKTNISELNRVIGYGIVKDSVTIITAKPGAGKSTLLLQLSDDLGKQNYKILYASGEESESQIKNRALRLNVNSSNIWIISTNSINKIEKEVNSLRPDILIVDSIQTMVDENISSKSGSPTQVNEVSNRIVRMSKYSDKKMASFIVGQMTKADELAGVRTLEHLVDTVLVLESNNTDHIRTMYSSKNRFGDTGEVGFFEMSENGLISIDDPSEYFVSNDADSFGICSCIAKKGSRYITIEIESLVSKSFFPYPQRISESVNKDNLNIIASIIDETTSLNLEDKNIILKAAGGVKLDDVSSDLAKAVSIISSFKKVPVPNDTIFSGEIGLTGKIKKVQNIKPMISEASRLGYKNFVVSKSQNLEEDFLKDKNINIIYIDSVSDIIYRFF